MTDTQIENFLTKDFGEMTLDELMDLEKTVTYEADRTAYVYAADYNCVDVELIERMEEKIGLLSLVFTLGYYGGVNYIDTLGTVAIWDSIIFRRLANMKIAIPQNKPSFKEDYEGGYVKETRPGRYEWVVSFDLNSLYPSLIIQYNMSPETIVKHMRVSNMNPEKILHDNDSAKVWAPEDGLALAANGACFRTDKQGILPTIVEEVYNQRVEVKKLMLKADAKLQKLEKGSKEYRAVEIEQDLASNRQMCLKILLNSLYGAAGNRFFRYYDIDIAEGITLAGQLAIQSVDKAINAYMAKACKDTAPKDRIIAADTDSVVGESVIEVNGGFISIADFYASLPNEMIKEDDFNENYVKSINEKYLTPSLDKNGSVSYNKILYAMKHKVSKELFEISDKDGNSVIITEDHSIIVQNRQTKKISEINPKKLDPKKHNIINIIYASDTDSYTRKIKESVEEIA